MFSILSSSCSIFFYTGRHGDGAYWPVDTNLIDRSSLNGKYGLNPICSKLASNVWNGVITYFVSPSLIAWLLQLSFSLAPIDFDSNCLQIRTGALFHSLKLTI